MKYFHLTQTGYRTFRVIELILCLDKYEMAKKLLTCRPDFPKTFSNASRNKKTTKNNDKINEKRHFSLIKSPFHVRLQIFCLGSYEMAKKLLTYRPDFPD